ncbi:MAG: RNA polymerase sigma factor [Patescibacteria group bacterium]
MKDKANINTNTDLPEKSLAKSNLLDDVQTKSDEELVLLTLANQDNFLHLIKRYDKKLFNYVLKISNFSREEAEDILQDAFIKIYKNLNEFDPSLKFSSWAYRIVRNQVISNYRKNKARPQKVELDNGIIENLASDLNITNEIDSKFLKRNINKVFNLMDGKYREVLFLKFMEEKNYQEISDILKKPIGTVATLINRAKKQFREELEKEDIKL